MQKLITQEYKLNKWHSHVTHPSYLSRLLLWQGISLSQVELISKLTYCLVSNMIKTESEVTIRSQKVRHENESTTETQFSLFIHMSVAFLPILSLQALTILAALCWFTLDGCYGNTEHDGFCLTSELLGNASAPKPGHLNTLGF